MKQIIRHSPVSAMLIIANLANSARSSVSTLPQVALAFARSVMKYYGSLFASDDLMIEDIAGFELYMRRRFFQVMQITQLALLTLSYIADHAEFTLPMHMLYGFFAVLNLQKILCLDPRFSRRYIAIWGMIDVFRYYALHLRKHMRLSVENVLPNMLILFGICFFSDSLRFNLAAAFVVAVLNSYVVSKALAAEGDAYQAVIHLLAFLLFHVFCLMIPQGYHITINEYSKRFEGLRIKAQAEIVSKSMFIASITHDLKNPISAINGTIDLLKTSAFLSPRDKKELRTAAFACQILLSLVGNITDVAKVESGKFEIDRIPMNILEEVSKIYDIESELSDRKNIRLHTLVTNAIPRTVYGDPMRFSQVLINLLGNAIKFTSHGYVGMVLRWVATVDEARNYEYTFSANGEHSPAIIPDESFFRPGNPLARTTLPSGDIRAEVEEELKSPIALLVPLGSCGNLKNELSKRTIVPRRGGSKNVPAEDLVEEFETSSPVWSKMRRYGMVAVPSALIAVRSDAFLERIPRSAPPTRADLGFHCQESCRGSISIAAEPRYTDGILLVDVLDTGVGISQDEQSRLFVPFSQANANVKRQFGGTGLGLWITRQLVQLMSGVVELKSVPGRGARFRVIVPMKVVESETSSSVASDSMGEVAETCAVVFVRRMNLW